MATTTLPSACCSSPSLKVFRTASPEDARPCPFAPPISLATWRTLAPCSAGAPVMVWQVRSSWRPGGAKIWDACNCSIHKIHCTRYVWPPKSQRTRGPPAFSVQGHALCGGHLLLRPRRRGCQGVARIVQRAGSPHRSCPDGRCRGWPGPCDQEQDRLKGQGVKISACRSQ